MYLAILPVTYISSRQSLQSWRVGREKNAFVHRVSKIESNVGRKNKETPRSSAAFVIYKGHMDVIDYSLIEREILAVQK